MRSVAVSKKGLVRKANQDSFYEGEKLYIVADGMGGYEGGEVASEIAINTIVAEVKDNDTIDEKAIKDAILKSNINIRKEMLSSPNLKGMGTTVVVASLSGGYLNWGNVGDSRLYIYGDNTLVQLTKDHSLVQTLVDSGVLPPEERNLYPKKNYLTRAVGVDAVIEIDTGRYAVKKGDKFLLCSDGLSAYITDEKIKAILETEKTEEDMLNKLVASVYDTGAKDNITIIIGVIE